MSKEYKKYNWEILLTTENPSIARHTDGMKMTASTTKKILHQHLFILYFPKCHLHHSSFRPVTLFKKTAYVTHIRFFVTQTCEPQHEATQHYFMT
jgi:hypothetical protein